MVGFAGFRGAAARRASRSSNGRAASAVADFDHALDEVLRSPLDRIIESAERIVERADGPLRSDYASYGNGHRRRGPPPSLRRALDERGSGAWAPHNRSRGARGRSGRDAGIGRPKSGMSRSRWRSTETLPATRSGARGHPDPRQPDRQRASVIRRMEATVRLTFDRTPATASVTVVGRRSGDRPGRSATNLRALRTRATRSGGTGLGPRHLSPACPFDGR